MSVQLRIGGRPAAPRRRVPRDRATRPALDWRHCPSCWPSTSLMPRPCSPRRLRQAQRSAIRWRTCSGPRHAQLDHLFGTAGTSVNTYATCHTMRTSLPQHRPSPECLTHRGCAHLGLPRRRGADRNRSRRTPTTSLDGRRQPDCQHRRSRNLPESQRLMSGHRTTAAKALGTLEVAHVIFAGSLPAGIASVVKPRTDARRAHTQSEPATRPQEVLESARPAS